MSVEALTQQQKDTFEFIKDNPDHLALVATALDGKPGAAIAFITQDEDGAFEVRPIALLIDDALFARLTDPANGLTVEVDR